MSRYPEYQIPFHLVEDIGEYLKNHYTALRDYVAFCDMEESRLQDLDFGRYDINFYTKFNISIAQACKYDDFEFIKWCDTKWTNHQKNNMTRGGLGSPPGAYIACVPDLYGCTDFYGLLVPHCSTKTLKQYVKYKKPISIWSPWRSDDFWNMLIICGKRNNFEVFQYILKRKLLRRYFYDGLYNDLTELYFSMWPGKFKVLLGDILKIDSMD